MKAKALPLRRCQNGHARTFATILSSVMPVDSCLSLHILDYSSPNTHHEHCFSIFSSVRRADKVQVLWHSQRLLRGEVCEDRKVVLQWTRHRNSVMHPDSPGKAHPALSICEGPMAWLLQPASGCTHTPGAEQWYLCAGESQVEGGAAAQGQPTGRHSAGVLLLRLAQHLCTGLCAGEEREQRGAAVPGPPCQRLRHQGAQPGPHSVAAPDRRQGLHALAGQAAHATGNLALAEVCMYS